jgi:hypothetical protein
VIPKLHKIHHFTGGYSGTNIASIRMQMVDRETGKFGYIKNEKYILLSNYNTLPFNSAALKLHDCTGSLVKFQGLNPLEIGSAGSFVPSPAFRAHSPNVWFKKRGTHDDV